MADSFTAYKISSDFLSFFGKKADIVSSTGANFNKYGFATGSLRFKFPMDVSIIPRYGDVHPHYSFMRLEDFSLSNDEGFYIVDANYVGIEGTETAKVYEFSGNVTQEPIETHPNWVTVLSNKNEFHPTLTSSQISIGGGTNKVSTFEVTNEKWNGITDYLVPSGTLSVTWYSTTAPSALNLSKIFSKVYDFSMNIGDKNWNQTGLTSRIRGGIYEIKEEYMLSGIRKWNTDVYYSAV